MISAEIGIILNPKELSITSILMLSQTFIPLAGMYVP